MYRRYRAGDDYDASDDRGRGSNRAYLLTTARERDTTITTVTDCVDATVGGHPGRGYPVTSAPPAFCQRRYIAKRGLYHATRW